MRLSQLLDPRRLAAARNDAPEGDGGACPWAAEDAAALAAQLAALAEMRELAVRMARAAAMERLAGVEADAAGDEEPECDEGAEDEPLAPSRALRAATPPP